MPEVLKELRAARQPVWDDELRRAVIRGVAAHAASIMRTLQLRTILAAAGVLVALMAVSATGGVAAGWWYFENQNAALLE